jgi:hypothetical protein
LNGPARDRLFGAVIANPAEMQVLSSQDVRDAIIASKDQAAAVDMILGPKSGSAKYGVLVNDLERVWQGQVHPRLIWEAHPLAVIAIGIGAFMLLLLMRRILRPRRVGAVASS